jgi:acetyl-CoA synthetase
MGDYAAARASFSWEAAAKSLGAPLAGPLNLGALAVGRGGSLVWHGARGEERRFSSDNLARGSARFANALAARGLARGDRVLIVGRAGPELVFAFLGALRFGAIPVVLGRLRSADALRHILGGTRPALVVTEPAFKTAIDPLRRSLPALKHVVFAGKEGAPPRPGPGEAFWEDLVGAAGEAFEDPLLPAGHPAWVHYSELGMSGAVTPHAAAFALASSAASVLDLRPGGGGITLAVPGDPLFLPYSILAPLLAGATSFLFEDPARFAGFGKFKDPVHCWYSPVRAIDVVLRNDPGLSDLLAKCRHVVVTHPYDASFIVMTQSSYGSPLHAAWWPRELGVIQAAEFRSGDIRVGSIGRPLPGVEMAVDKASGGLALRVGPGSPFGGYWNDPEQTARRVRDGWFVTDQRGRIDPDGYAWIVA